MARLTNAYLELIKEMGKYTIRMNMLENQLKQLKKPGFRDEAANRESTTGSGVEDVHTDHGSLPRHMPAESDAVKKFKAIDVDGVDGIPGTRRFAGANAETAIENRKEPEEHTVSERPDKVVQQNDQNKPKKPGASLDPEKLKVWEEWQEPKEWKENGE
jgi:hypothetical protein